MKMNNLRKAGGVIALLASFLSISDSASAIGLTVSNLSGNGTIAVATNNAGQSFTFAGTGTTILLNDWSFVFNSSASATTASSQTLSIYSGNGNGSAPLYNSTTATTFTLGALGGVKWSFSGASLTDNATYTAVIQGISPTGTLVRSNLNPYSGGTAYSGTTAAPTIDLIFQGNATVVPFEFEPTGGLAVLGGGWLLCRHLKKKKT
jgi:hypothetical protein